MLDEVGLERGRVLRLEHVLELAERHADAVVEAQNLRAVLRLAREVLLYVRPGWGSPGRRIPRQRAVDARLRRAVGADDLAVLVLLRVLAELPDAPVGVLRVPVVRVLYKLAVLHHDVVDDSRFDAHVRRVRPVTVTTTRW